MDGTEAKGHIAEDVKVDIVTIARSANHLMTNTGYKIDIDVVIEKMMKRKIKIDHKGKEDGRRRKGNWHP